MIKFKKAYRLSSIGRKFRYTDYVAIFSVIIALGSLGVTYFTYTVMSDHYNRLDSHWRKMNDGYIAVKDIYLAKFFRTRRADLIKNPPQYPIAAYPIENGHYITDEMKINSRLALLNKVTKEREEGLPNFLRIEDLRKESASVGYDLSDMEIVKEFSLVVFFENGGNTKIEIHNCNIELINPTDSSNTVRKEFRHELPLLPKNHFSMTTLFNMPLFSEIGDFRVRIDYKYKTSTDSIIIDTLNMVYHSEYDGFVYESL